MQIFNNLKKILIFNYLLVALLPILVSGSLVFRSVIISIKTEIKEKNYLLVRSLAGEVGGFLDEALNTLGKVGDLFESKDIIAEEKSGAYLDSIIKRHRFFEMIQVLDKQGRIRDITPHDPDYPGIDMSRQEYFKEAGRLKAPYRSESSISIKTGQAMITLSVPLEELTVVGFLDLNRLNDITDRVRLGDTGYALITDHVGTVIAHRDRSLVSERANIANLEIIKQALAGREGTFLYRQGVEERIGSMALVPRTGWAVMINQATGEAFSFTRRILNNYLVVIILTLTLALSLAAWSLRRILRPISQLVLTTKKITAGNYRISLIPGSYREVDELAWAFRAMCGAVNSREEALRKSEEKYRELVQNANSIIFRWDREGRITFINEYALDFFGYSEEELLGKPPLGTFIPERESTGRNLEEMVKDIVANPQNYVSNENENVKMNGERVWVQWSNKPIYNEAGELVEILSVGTDITERKKLEEQLRQAQKMETVGRLAGGIAHDFNNLITAINGYSELILSDLKQDDPLRRDILEIKKAGERAASLTEQLLAFSRRQILQPEVLDLNLLIGDLEGILRRLIGEDIELVMVLGQGSMRIKADPTRIQQIVMNLAINARDAMPQGGKLVIKTASLKIEKDDSREYPDDVLGDYVLLSMNDTGVGMDPETQANIFEPFFTTKEIGKGTGLGLSMVYGIIKQSGGSISVASEIGKGSTFNIYLPRISQPPGQTQPQKVSMEDFKGTETILLVEDEELLRNLNRNILEKNGYNVLTARKGNEALRLCSEYKRPLDLILSDVVMPGMSGKELADQMSAAYPDLKVLFTSGYTKDTVVRHGVLQEGINFIQKPYKTGDLLKKIREILDERVSPKEVDP